MEDFQIENNVLIKLNNLDKKEIIIPEGVKTIGRRAFKGSTISEVTCPKSLVKIECEAFSNCKLLKRITFHNDSLKNIAFCSFFGCTFLEDITFPESLLHIGNNAFYGCKRLKDIYIPKNVNYIGVCPFEDCISLKKIEISKDNPYYSDMDSNIIYRTETDELIQGCKTSIIPSITKEIGPYAFANMKSQNLKELMLPKSIELIGEFAFRNINNLEKIIINSKNEVFIEAFAFENCKGLKDVFIYNNEDEIYINGFAFDDDSGHALNKIKIYVTNINNLKNNKEEDVIVTKNDFKERYKNQIIPFTLDELINQNKSIKEINNILKKANNKNERI